MQRSSGRHCTHKLLHHVKMLTMRSTQRIQQIVKILHTAIGHAPTRKKVLEDSRLEACNIPQNEVAHGLAEGAIQPNSSRDHKVSSDARPRSMHQSSEVAWLDNVRGVATNCGPVGEVVLGFGMASWHGVIGGQPETARKRKCLSTNRLWTHRERHTPTSLVIIDGLSHHTDSYRFDQVATPTHPQNPDRHGWPPVDKKTAEQYTSFTKFKPKLAMPLVVIKCC